MKTIDNHISSLVDDLSCVMPDREFIDLGLTIWNAYDDLCESLVGPDRALVLSDAYFVILLLQHVHVLISSKRYARRDGKSALGPSTACYEAPNWESIATEHVGSIKCDRWVNAVRGVKKLARNIRYNPQIPIINRMGRVRAMGLGTHCELRAEYLKNNHLYLDSMSIPLLFKNCTIWKCDVSRELKTNVGQFLAVVNDCCERRGGGTLCINEVMNCWIGRLQSLKALYDHLFSMAHLPESLLIAGAAKPLNKLVSQAFQAKGKRTLAFHHGNCMGGLDSPVRQYLDTNTGAEYVCPTGRCAESYKRNYGKYRMSKIRPTTFVSLETAVYERLWKQCQAYSLPERVRNVMIIGYPMKPSRSVLPARYFTYHLDLELRLIKLLKQAGYNILYKIHPDRVSEVEGIYRPLCDKLIVDSFEYVWHEADAIIFNQTGTTTFGHAVCTNRPIILLDTERGYWNSEHYQLLKKRCHIVDAFNDDSGRVVFDEDIVLKSLRQKPEYPYFGYVREFMFPEFNNDVGLGIN